MTSEFVASAYMAAAAARAALRALGGIKVSLRICGGSDEAGAVGLGLRAPLMESVELAPVLVRSGADGVEQIVVDALTIESATGAFGEELQRVLRASRIQWNGSERRISAVRSDHLGGAAYLYRLSLEA